MKLSYAKPVHRGVTMLMGVGQSPEDTAPYADAHTKALKQIGFLSGGVWLVGLFSKSADLTRLGMGGVLASIGITILSKRPQAMRDAESLTKEAIDEITESFR